MHTRYYRTMLKQEPEVLTVPDVARILRIGKNKAYELVHSGQIEPIRLGKRILIPKYTLIAFMMERNQKEVNE